MRKAPIHPCLQQQHDDDFETIVLSSVPRKKIIFFCSFCNIYLILVNIIVVLVQKGCIFLLRMLRVRESMHPSAHSCL